MTALQSMGHITFGGLQALGHVTLFCLRLLRSTPATLRRAALVVAQIYTTGNRSLALIMAAGAAVGLVLALQLYYTLSTYGATESLGLVVNLSLVRELGPVVAALLFAGRAGTSLTAEIGLMKAGEQLLAMELMAIDPLSRVLAPRFIAGIMVMPLLAVLFSTVGILGAYVVAVPVLGVDAGNFWSIQQNGVDVWRDVGNGLIKSFVFGVVVTATALYQGYEARPTPEGVSAATTRGVIIASLCVLCTDFILTALMFSTP